MRIIGRNASQVRASVREAVKIIARRNRGLSGTMVAMKGSSGGICTTMYEGPNTRVKWVVGDPPGQYITYQ